MLKLNKLLFYTVADDVFSNNIAPTDDQRATLAQAKNDIRDHLRPGIARATVALLGMARQVEPRFRTQGSWAYKACIQPYMMPPQEMDWDFGVYLPVDVWEENGPPHVMAKAYFQLVESLLEGLCREKGWKLVDGKDTCIRVQVAAWGHIDVPLYAAPAKQFALIQDRVLAKSAQGVSVRDSEALFESAEAGEFTEQLWEELDDIMMACRSGVWVKSDPEKVARWFNDAVLLHTEQLRRVCCYVKAWRDKEWERGGPSSVCLMLGIAQGFATKTGRDDIALEQAFRTLATALKGPIREPIIDDGAEDFNRLDPQQRQDAAARALLAADNIQRARMRDEYDKNLAIGILREVLGDRVPFYPHLVEVDSVAVEVTSTPARQVAPPVIYSTTAG